MFHLQGHDIFFFFFFFQCTYEGMSHKERALIESQVTNGRGSANFGKSTPLWNSARELHVSAVVGGAGWVDCKVVDNLLEIIGSYRVRSALYPEPGHSEWRDFKWNVRLWWFSASLPDTGFDRYIDWLDELLFSRHSHHTPWCASFVDNTDGLWSVAATVFGGWGREIELEVRLLRL